MARAPSEATLMSVLERRWSCRAFLPDAVPDELVREMFAMAQRTPSWCNTQPWEVWVTAPAETDVIRQALLEAVDRSRPAEPTDLARPVEYTGARLDRRRACGWQLYEAVGITRGDRLSSAAQARRNFELFGAPHLAIVTAPAELADYGPVDVGLYVATLLYAADALGLGAIAQAAVAHHSALLHCHFDIPDDRRIVVAVSFGYADLDHPANRFRTARAAIEECVHWVGFDESGGGP